MRTEYGVVHTTSQLLYSILHDLITDSHPSDAREDRGDRALSVPVRTAISLAMYDPEIHHGGEFANDRDLKNMYTTIS
jgi:hypothetical protein